MLNDRQKGLCSVVFFWLSLIFGGATIFGQVDLNNDAKIYENQQRALKLSLLKNEIKGLEDAPMRCFARMQVSRFIFGARINDYFDTAIASALDCLDDIQSNSNQFSGSQASYWKNTMIVLLRQNAPDIGSKAAKKYLGAEDSSLSYLQEINSGNNLAVVTSRISTEIAQGNIPSDIVPIVQKLRQTNAVLSTQILDVLLAYFESNPNIDFAIKLDFLSGYYMDDSIPLEIELRFLRFIVMLAQKQLVKADVTDLYDTSFSMLRNALPKIKELTPSLYDQAAGVYLAMEGQISSANKERDEAYKRIDESKDKMQQAIFEAEAADRKSFQDSLWLYASQLAIGRKKFQIAVDCRLKVALGNKMFVIEHDHFLLNRVIPGALKEKDFESADYALQRIADVQNRSSGFLQVASEYLSMGNKAQAFERLEEALKLLQKADANANGVRINLLAVTIAMGIDKSTAFDIASSAIRMANHLQTPNPDDKTGTPLRVEYTDRVLLPTAINFATAFKVLAKADVGFASATAQEIQSKSWRLAAEIIVETERKYLLPVKAKTSAQNAVQ